MNLSSKSVTWLHFSDLHFNHKDLGRFERVLTALWKDVRRQVTTWQPDLIFITGDVAYSGVQEDYNSAVKLFFNPLLEVTALDKDKLFVVPGNHDVEWALIKKTLTQLSPDFLAQLDDPKTMFELLEDESWRGLAFRPMRDYKEFIKEYFEDYNDHGILIDPLFGYTQIIKLKNDATVAVMGLNSAWLSGFKQDANGEPIDRGNLLVGEPQVKKVLKAEGIEEANIRIALTHHPPNWLREPDEHLVKRDIYRGCDFLLQGHMHKPSFVKQSGLTETVHIIPAGSILETKRLRCGYNCVRLNLDLHAVGGKGTIWLRRYDDDYDRWVKDVGATGDDLEGRLEFDWP